MSTIFPGSASVGQVYNNYTFDGTAWNINGIDLTENYLEESSASATYLTKVSASNTYITQTSASITYATKTELENIDLSSASAAAVSAIVDSAPETLNTLNELAAALNDDANFSSTVTTALGNKLDSSTASTTYQTIVSGVSNTEIGYLDGVTSAIQTQLNAKANLSGATFTGDITTTKLTATSPGGDEGGEINLAKAVTNTTLNTGVVVDVNQNRLRFFEQGGNNRGGYIDLATLPNGVSTNLVPGLAKMIPTSVSVGSGSGSVSSGGTITFSGASHVQINGCFTSAYKNYQILINPTGSAGALTQITLSVSGTPISSPTGYSNTFTYNQYGSTAVAGLSNNATSAWVISAINTDATQSQIIDLFNPQAADGKSGRFFANYIGTYVAMGGIRNPITTSCDGFRYAPQSGTVSGTITVYGYNN